MRTGKSIEPPDSVISLQPRSAETIRRLFREDEDFSELCGDYAECLAMLDRLRKGQIGAEERTGQYLELRVNLEHELLHHLRREVAGHDPSSTLPVPAPELDASRKPLTTPKK